VIALSSFLVGFILAGIFKVDVKISKKEDYEKKLKELNEVIAGFENKESVVYRKDELFPADLNRDYGIPKDLK
jgi:hypothetical protein